MREVGRYARAGQTLTATSVMLGVALISATWLTTASPAMEAVALPAAILLIVNTVNMRVRSYAPSLKTLLAFGYSPRRLHKAVLNRAGRLGLIGSVLGGGLGLAVAVSAGVARHQPGAVAGAMAGAVAVGAGTTVLTAAVAVRRLSATRRAGRRSPTSVGIGLIALTAGAVIVAVHPGGHLSKLDLSSGGAGALLIWTGIILLAPLLALAVLRPVAFLLSTYGGRMLRVALRDVVRHPHRTAATASSLLVGVSLVCAFAAAGRISGLVLAVALFEVVRAIVQSGLERGGEIRVLRSLGASRPFVGRAVRREGAVIGVCGVLLGLAAGLVIGGVLQHVLRQQPIERLELPSATVPMLAALVAAAAVASWWTTQHATHGEAVAH
jgi:ABC-type antimicrobial peptide transport system permease subunit